MCICQTLHDSQSFINLPSSPASHSQDIGYRARDPRNLNRVIAEIKELKKKVAARAKESEEKQTLVDQAELSIGRNGAFAKLRDVTVKPVRREKQTN